MYCAAAAGNRTLTCGSRADATVLLLRAGLVKLIEQQFIKRSRLVRSGIRGRSTMLNEFQPWLSRLKTYRSCLACLQRVPEHKFPCDHMFCEACCTDLGQCFDKDPHLYEFVQCPLCEFSCDVSIRVRPVTAGIRVLSVDGGGIRAVIPIQFLRALEQAIGLDMPVQEHFDFSYGTSSGTCPRITSSFSAHAPYLGSMVNLALYGLGMRVDEAYDLFRQLSRRVFRGRNRFGIGFAAAAHALIASYRNGRFPAEDIDGPLSEIFGNATMLEHPYMSSIGARTGFPVVNVDTLDTCIITSYNGVGQRQSHDDSDQKATYKVLRADGPNNDICVKDA